MKRKAIFTVVITVVLLASTSGIAAAAPGEGPPGDLPDPVPEFVSDLLGAIGEFVGGLVQNGTGFVDGLTPDAAGDGIGTAADAVSR